MKPNKLIEYITRDRTDLGLLVIRVLIGFSMASLHGYGKLVAGPQMWAGLGGSMGPFGLGLPPVFWGFLAMAAEFFASIAIILGVAFRPAAAMLIINMLVAALHHLTLPAGSQGAGLKPASHALELMVVFLGLFITGPGKYRLSRLWNRGE
jgi:putative oxidoreductase